MPDVFDPYEERGAPNPHHFDDRPFDIEWIAANHGSSNVTEDPATQAERAEARRRRRERAAKRIRPGFYRGVEPHDGM